MAVVTEEARIRVRRADGVGDEVERVGHLLPVGHDLGNVIVDGDVRIGVDGLADAAQVPPVPLVVGEPREVERLGRRHDEEVSDARIVLDPPGGRVREEEPIVTAAAHDVRCVGVQGEKQGDPSVGVDPKDRGEGILTRAVIDPHVLPAPEHRLLSAAVEPDPGLEASGSLLARRRTNRAREGEDQSKGGKA